MKVILAVLFASLPTISFSNNDQPLMIQAWQYCAGCKGLLELLTGKASEMLAEKEKQHVDKYGSNKKFNYNSVRVDAHQLTTNICQNKYYDNYVPEMKYRHKHRNHI